VLVDPFGTTSAGRVTSCTNLPGALLRQLPWRKSRRSNSGGNCVELARLPEDVGYAVRNSRDPDGPALVFTRDEMIAFLGGIRDGDFDDLVA
jgi:Domain of unknown function (DUF397)